MRQQDGVLLAHLFSFGFDGVRLSGGTSGRRIEHGDLLSEGEDFEGRVASTAEEDAHHGEDRKNEFRHQLTLVTWRNVARAGQRLQTAKC